MFPSRSPYAPAPRSPSSKAEEENVEADRVGPRDHGERASAFAAHVSCRKRLDYGPAIPMTSEQEDCAMRLLETASCLYQGQIMHRLELCGCGREDVLKFLNPTRLPRRFRAGRALTTFRLNPLRYEDAVRDETPPCGDVVDRSRAWHPYNEPGFRSDETVPVYYPSRTARYGSGHIHRRRLRADLARGPGFRGGGGKSSWFARGFTT